MKRRNVRPGILTGFLTPALLLGALLVPIGGAAPATAADAPPPYPNLYPAVGAGTSFLDHDVALAGMPAHDWFESNIPFVDLPDEEIESTYYYRWRLYKEALKYTGPDDGWIVTEFLGPVGYAAPGGAISAAAAHHLYEGRWLRDQRYTDDYVDYWLTGAGSTAKPATDGLNENTTDWAHQYSFWVADAVLAQAKIDGDLAAAEALLPELEEQWQGWAPQFNEELGLYWQVPVWDAMEFTASSYQSDDPYHGGEGYRPTLNAYQYGDAMAISELARLTGDDEKADRYAASAANLQTAQETLLWDTDDQFYKHVMRDNNLNNEQLADREQIGFIPWYFNMAPAENAVAWAQLLDPDGFKATYGPTTVEKRSEWYMHEAENGCCRWDGPSWPYATSQTLTALGNLLADYPPQEYVDANDFTGLLHDYAMTQRKNGQPYVAEAHHPDGDRWMYDGVGHSEDYNHSTFNDIVLGSLIGIKGQDDDTVRIAPQVDESWDHFAAENVPYHGHNLTVLWDADGSHYGAGAGLSVFEDGELIHNQSEFGDVTVAVNPVDPGANALPVEVDDASNQYVTGFPKASASYSNDGDPASKAIDGQDFQLDIPKTRWTNYGTTDAIDWLQVDFGVATPVSDVRTTFYDDGGGVRTPVSYDVEYQNASGEWTSLPGQNRVTGDVVGGAVNRILLDEPIVTSSIRLVGQKQPGAGGIGVTAFGSWRSLDDNLTASVATRADGSVAVTPGETTDVVTSVVIGNDSSSVASDALYAPAGWTVERASDAIPADAAAGTYATTWQVTAPAGLDASADSPLRYVVESTTPGLGAGDIALANWVFDSETFGDAVWDDDFGTDRLAEYTTSDSLGEPAPELVVDTAAGTLNVSAEGRARRHIQIPVQATSSFALIVEPEAFADGSPGENSVFIGSSGSSRDFAMSWYNHSKNQGGVNVVVDGQGKGEAEGGGSHAVTWDAGERLATVVTEGQLTSWVEEDGVWKRISAAPVSNAVAPATLAEWFPSFSIRLDPGTISIDRVTVLQGGLDAVIPADVTFTDVSGTADDTYTVPSTAGVEYVIGEEAVEAGIYDGAGTVTVSARAASGSTLALDATTSWEHTFSGLVDPIAVTPAAVTFTDASGTADNSYTVPVSKGIEYVLGDAVVEAGTYPGSGAVTVMARALADYVLAEGAVAEWSHTFSDVVDPGVPIDPIDPGTQTPAPGAGGNGGDDGDLASTGVDVGLAGLAALLLLMMGGIITYRRRVRTQ